MKENIIEGHYMNLKCEARKQTTSRYCQTWQQFIENSPCESFLWKTKHNKDSNYKIHPKKLTQIKIQEQRAAQGLND